MWSPAPTAPFGRRTPFSRGHTSGALPWTVPPPAKSSGTARSWNGYDCLFFRHGGSSQNVVTLFYRKNRGSIPCIRSSSLGFSYAKSIVRFPLSDFTTVLGSFLSVFPYRFYLVLSAFPTRKALAARRLHSCTAHGTCGQIAVRCLSWLLPHISPALRPAPS